MNYDGLKSAIIELLSGAEVPVNTVTFKNDAANFTNKDDVLTYMIHLGYLGYNQDRRTAFVPNEEIRQELTAAVHSRAWNEMIKCNIILNLSESCRQAGNLLTLYFFQSRSVKAHTQRRQ